MVDPIRLLAIVHTDTGHVDSDIVRANHNAMILEGIFGLIISVSAGGDKSAGDPAGMVLKGILQGNKIIQKELIPNYMKIKIQLKQNHLKTK